VQMQEYHPAPEARVAAAVPTRTLTTSPFTPPDPTNPPQTPTSTRAPGPTRDPHRRFSGFVVSLALVATGILGMIDLAGANVAASAYVAVPLAIVGLGLIVRAWYGRGWSLAIIGAVLALGLVMVTGVEQVGAAATTSSTWRPLTVDQVNASYIAKSGNTILDLSSVDFTGQSKNIRVSLDAGNLTVVVPSKVDVQAEARVNIGNAVVFGERWGGIGQSTHTVTDVGSDGPGGGALVLHATVNVGNVEVRR
jgi:Cell wall-active antibiotics response LiaF, C-terminal